MRRNENKPPLVVEDLSLQLRDGIALLRLIDVVFEKAVNWAAVERKTTAQNIECVCAGMHWQYELDSE
jgi:hypothetical protein